MEPVEVFQRPPWKSRDIAVSKMAEILTFDCAGPMPPRVFQIRMSGECSGTGCEKLLDVGNLVPEETREAWVGVSGDARSCRKFAG